MNNFQTMEDKQIKPMRWLFRYTATVLSCTAIIVFGITAVSKSAVVTTSIGQNISTNDFIAYGNATTTGDHYVGGNLTMAGKLAITRIPTLPHTFSTWDTNVANSNVTDASFLINPASAITDTNLFGIAVNNNVKFMIDAEGDVFVNSLTATGTVTQALTNISTLNVENNSTFGDAITDTVTFDSGNLIFTNSSTTTIPASINAHSFATSTTATPILSMDGLNGRVGIGIASPNNLIQVAGLINFNTTKSLTLLGYLAGNSNTGGSANTFIGEWTGYSNTNGFRNSIVGHNSFYSNTTGNSNSALGTYALYNSTTGNYNSAMGQDSLWSNTTGSSNVGMGYQSLFYNQTGTYNVAVGQDAGRGVSGNSFQGNSLFGYRAGYGLSTGSMNTLLGYIAGENITTGSNNIIIGNGRLAPSATGNDQLNIGDLIYGDLDNGYFGIGTTSPYAQLSVAGDGVFTGNIGLSGASVNSNRAININLTTSNNIKYGIYNTLNNAGTGSEVFGLYNKINDSSITALTSYGVYNELNADSSNIQTLYGVYNKLLTYSNDEAYGLYVAGDAASTGGNQYGLYIDLNDPNVNNYGVYVNSGTSYFGSNVGIGTTSPYAKLSVSGIGVFDDYVRSSYFIATSTTASSTFPMIVGSQSSGGNLWLGSTQHATKGKILFGNSAYDEVNNRLGIGTASPGYALDVNGSASIQNNLLTQLDGGTYYGRNQITENQWSVGGDRGLNWIARDARRDFRGIAMSSDGKYQTATVNNGNIYISSDYGVTWTAKASALAWRRVAMSSDGKYQTAVVSSGQIYVSTDYGATWSAKDSSRAWTDVAMSSDGQKQTAVVYPGYIYTSTDYGATWTQRESSRSWSSVAMSSDGKYQTAISGNTYISRDYGVTWVTATGGSGGQMVAMSSDGKYQSLAVYETGIRISSDYGANWTLKTPSGSNNWTGVAMSADGKYQSAYEDASFIYTSTDYGNTWTIGNLSKWWIDIAMSSDGKYQTAVAWGTDPAGSLYTSHASSYMPMGNVGVATSTPYAKLSVSGIGVFDDYVYSSYFTATSTTASSTFPMIVGSQLSGGNLWLGSTQHATKGKILFGNSAYDEVNNRLGIGTASPNHQLEIYSNSSGSEIIGLNLKNIGSANNTGTAIGFLPASGTVQAGKISVIKDNSSSGLYSMRFSLWHGTNEVITENMRISGTTGYVGIGDSSPDSLLDIRSTTAENTYIKVTNTNAGDYDTAIGFELVEGTHTFTIGVDNSDSDKFKISTTALGTNDRFVIDSSGLVGIGTSSPYAKLSVSGIGVFDDYVRSSYFIATSTTASSTFPMIVGSQNSGGNLWLGSTQHATKGKILFGNSAYDEVNNRMGIASSSPFATFAVEQQNNDNIVFLVADTGTSTPHIKVDGAGITYIEQLQTGAMSFDTNAGAVVWNNLPVSATAASGTIQSYTAQIDSTNILTVYALSNGAGGVTYPSVGVGTTTPTEQFSVADRMYIGGAGTSTIQNNLRVMGTLRAAVSYTGDLIFANQFRFTESEPLDQSPRGLMLKSHTSADLLYINENGYVGIGTTTPGAPLTVHGNALADAWLTYEVVEMNLYPENEQEQFEEGDLLSISDESGNFVKASQFENYPIIGVAKKLDLWGETTYKPAMLGTFTIKVSTENGDIYTGDYLTKSSVPGVAMRANEGDPTVGFALDNYFGDSTAVIKMFINVSRASGGTSANPTDTSAPSSGFSLSAVWDLVLDEFKLLGITFKNGIVKAREFVGDIVKTKNLEMTDEATGQIYCVKIVNGEWNKTLGACGSPVPVSSPDPVPVSEPTFAPQDAGPAPISEPAL